MSQDQGTPRAVALRKSREPQKPVCLESRAKPRVVIGVGAMDFVWKQKGLGDHDQGRMWVLSVGTPALHHKQDGD